MIKKSALFLALAAANLVAISQPNALMARSMIPTIDASEAAYDDTSSFDDFIEARPAKKELSQSKRVFDEDGALILTLTRHLQLPAHLERPARVTTANIASDNIDVVLVAAVPMMQATRAYFEPSRAPQPQYLTVNASTNGASNPVPDGANLVEPAMAEHSPVTPPVPRIEPIAQIQVEAVRPIVANPGSKPTQIVIAKKPATIAEVRKAETPIPPPIKGAQIAGSAGLNTPLPIKPLAQPVPGVGTIPGEVSDLRAKPIRVGADRNELVYIALGQLNKIATPFATPQIIDSTGAVSKVVGQDIFFQPINDKPLTVYITNGGVGQSIGLTLVPKANLPAQSIILQPESPAILQSGRTEPEEEIAGDYVSRLTAIMRSLSLGKTPNGYTKSRLPSSVAAGKELVIEPQFKYSGASYDLFSYRIRSIASSPLELREEAFYSESVRAVSFYPHVMLQTGEDTQVFVIADRSQGGAHE